MKKHAFTRIAAAAAVGSFAVMTTGTADARPIESPNCRGIAQAIDSSMYMADRARDQGNEKLAREYMKDAARASANYKRHCQS